MKKGEFSNFLRKVKLLYIADFLKYCYEKFTNRHINKKFKHQYPDVKLPPDYLLYESFMLNYSDYYFGGENSAVWLCDHLQKHIELKDKKILDWGCGPGRIIRHLPGIVRNGCRFYGTDYNTNSVEWCSANLPDVSFNQNSLEAKLPYEDNFFNVIYGISVFTHLSEKKHYEWFDEIFRVLKKGGVLFFTTQGINFRGKLTDPELKRFDAGELIVRGNVKEGHRTYSAFHPVNFMQALFHNVQIAEHIVINDADNHNISQDVWILKK